MVGSNRRLSTKICKLFELKPVTSLLSMLLLTVPLALILQTGIAHASEIRPLTYTENQAKTVIDVLNKLNARHYREQRINNDFSERFLENYLDTLDPSKVFFLSKDVDNFYRDKHKYDDYFKAGNLKPGFDVYHLYRQRVTARLDSVLAQLQNQAHVFSFESNDEILVNRKEAPWPANAKEADSLWHKRIKLGLLNLVLSGKTLDEAKVTLTKRYKNQLKRIKQQDNADIFETLVNAFALLYDPHTNYWSPRTSENFNINMSLSLEGIGAVLQSEDEFTKVVRLVAGGPASKQGQLKPADRIVGVGQGDKGEIVDVVGWRLDEVVQLIRGPKNTLVKLEILPAEAAANGGTKTIQINRGRVKLEDQAAEKAVMDIQDGDRQYKVGIINLPTFYIDFDAYHNHDPNFKSSTRDVARLLDELMQENVDGVVLDLRNNGGGSLREATMLTDLFIDRGPVVQIRSPNGRINRHNRSLSKARYRGPLIVLVNRLSASASEIFAGAIQDYQRGLIVGSQSFGKGTVQSVTPLHEGRLKITESKFYRVSGDSTQHRGVIPDISFPLMVDFEEVGESAYDNPLPWDKIHSVQHARYFDFASIMPNLRSQHKARVANDPDFNFILDQLATIKQNKEKTTISLNKKIRLQEKDDLERKAMSIENKRRLAKKMTPYKTLAEFRKLKLDKDEEDKKALTAQQSKHKIDLEEDTLLNETGHIMVDFIRLQEKPSQQQAANF